MNELSIKDGITELGVTTEDGKKAVVSSRDVADTFGKRHSDVLRAIDNTLDDLEDSFAERNFALSDYKGRSGKKNREYLLTRDGFTLIAMGFTGKKAMKFKVMYINQFNKMEQLIKERCFAKIEYAPMMTAVKESREAVGKKTNHFHYSNEANMINRIVIGATSKKYCEEHDIPKNKLRDHLPKWQLETIKQLQRANTHLIQMGLDYQERKELLSKKYKHLFNNLRLDKEEI